MVSKLAYCLLLQFFHLWQELKQVVWCEETETEISCVEGGGCGIFLCFGIEVKDIGRQGVLADEEVK